MLLNASIRVLYEFIAYYWRRLKILKCMPTVLVRPFEKLAKQITTYVICLSANL